MKEVFGYIIELNPWDGSSEVMLTCDDGIEMILDIPSKKVYREIIKRLMPKYNRAPQDFFHNTQVAQAGEINRALQSSIHQQFRFIVDRKTLKGITTTKWHPFTRFKIQSLFSDKLKSKGELLFREVEIKSDFQFSVNVYTGCHHQAATVFASLTPRFKFPTNGLSLYPTGLTKDYCFSSIIKIYHNSNPDKFSEAVNSIQNSSDRMFELLDLTRLIRLSDDDKEVKNALEFYVQKKFISRRTAKSVLNSWTYRRLTTGADRLYDFILLISDVSNYFPDRQKEYLQRLGGELILVTENWKKFVGDLNA